MQKNKGYLLTAVVYQILTIISIYTIIHSISTRINNPKLQTTRLIIIVCLCVYMTIMAIFCETLTIASLSGILEYEQDVWKKFIKNI